MGVSDRWSDAATVGGFATGTPNPALIELAAREVERRGRMRVLDIGCGAGRNALPLAALGAHVIGIDRSRAMLDAGRARAQTSVDRGRVDWVRSAADALPLKPQQFDLIVAHGIWNLSRSFEEFRQSLAEAARVARPGAALFVVTFSRHTLPADVAPVAGERFVFTQLSGQPQCFLTEDELASELAAVGFRLRPGEAVRELNRPQHQALRAGGPVLLEGVFFQG